MSKDLDNANVLLPINVNKIFEGRYAIIKPITENEINDRYLSWVNDKEINRYLEVRHKKQNKKSLIEYINLLRRRNKCELFAIFTKKDLIHIGNATITGYNANNLGIGDFGIMIGDIKAQSMGLGAEIHVILLEYFFRDPSILRINAGVASQNTNAWKTLESLGYIRDVVKRKYVPLENGKRCDGYFYRILRDEWLLQRNKLKKIIDSVVISDL